MGAVTMQRTLKEHPLGVYRGALIVDIRLTIERLGGLEERNRCEKINTNDTDLKSGEKVRIKISNKRSDDGEGENRDLELVWIFRSNEWLLLDYNVT